MLYHHLILYSNEMVYCRMLLIEKNIKVSRLARGLPVGSELEYTDDATLMRAMEGRTII